MRLLEFPEKTKFTMIDPGGPNATGLQMRSRFKSRTAPSPRQRIMSVTAPLTAALLAGALLTPTGFAIRSPGPTEDTLGSQLRRVPVGGTDNGGTDNDGTDNDGSAGDGNSPDVSGAGNQATPGADGQRPTDAEGNPLATTPTLGTQDPQVPQTELTEVPLVEITGAETYPASGKLLLTTVAVAGGPIGAVFPLDTIGAWASGNRAVLPVEAVFPRNITREQQQEQSAAQMITSQQAATAAALTELEYDIPITLRVIEPMADSGAVGKVEPEDIIVSLNGKPMANHNELLAELGQVTPGDTVSLGIIRDGQPMDVPIVTGTAELEDGGQRAALGVFVRSDFDFPIDVQIQIENIGGPSAGMMFALAIIDRLTPQDELAGTAVAGTGTVSVDGQVGPIGGIEQKMVGALRDGAHWFLAPEANCGEVVGNIPEGMRVVKVATLHDARTAIEAIGEGTGDALPTCTD
jgi:Lon-like protease